MRTFPRFVPIACTLLFIANCSDSGGSDSNELPPPGVGQLVDANGNPLSPAGESTATGTSPAGTEGMGAPPATTGGAMVAVPTMDLDTGGIVEGNEPTTPEEPMACQSASTPTALQGVVLAFAFDVSASMGALNEPYNDKTLKWDPVVAATKAFFANSASAGVSALLTFFPSESASLSGTFGGGGGGGRQGFCTADEYVEPDVALTPLPSDAFGAAIDAITPADMDSWRMGTPTMAVLKGTIENVQALQAADAANHYVIVLVTDGEPALCDMDSDNIDNVAAVAAGVSDTIPTYVIGVSNPVTPEEPNPPDTVSNLNVIAEQGGTEKAFIINTDDPAKTATDFQAVIESIRSTTFSCNLPIPAPPEGKSFDRTKVNVTYTNKVGTDAFIYDETCTERLGWHYDDKENPKFIQMCDEVCGQIRADVENEGALNVEFGCETRVGVAH